MFCAFSVGLGLWCWNLYTFRANAHRIHYLMTALGCFKVLTLLAQCAMFHYVRVTGQPDGWNIAYYIFTLFRGVFLFSVIVLIGTGWSYMTPFLGDRDKRVLMAVIPLQARSLHPTRATWPWVWSRACRLPLGVSVRTSCTAPADVGRHISH